jgi:protein-tyrosine phosphatase/nicotinamidase-related amidase
MKAILITQCLQNDFVKPLGKYDKVPNLLHIGYEEAKRLNGLDPSKGPVSKLMHWAYEQHENELDIIHIRDWHDPSDKDQRKHLDMFGEHCIHDTPGADFVFNFNKNIEQEVVDSLGLNDFVGTRLESVLDKYKEEHVKVGLVGVWSEAKVSFLAYDLVTRYPNFEVVICPALCAGSSVLEHHTALERGQKLLGVKLINSIGQFTQYLTGNATGADLGIDLNSSYPILSTATNETFEETTKAVLKYLFRSSKKVDLKSLTGGYSGNIVMKTDSVDMQGREEVGHVVKIGDPEEIGRERIAFEKIEPILGNAAPRIDDFIDYKDLSGIKFRYASMGKGDSKTLKELMDGGASIDEIERILRIVFEDQLGKLYKTASFEKVNLFDYYNYDPSRANRLKQRIEELWDMNLESDMISYKGLSFPNPYHFYKNDLEGIMNKANRSSFFSSIHGDLNSSNIIVDSQSNVWIIDFFHTHHGHVIRDLLKLENDLLYILNDINSIEDVVEATKISKVIFSIKDLRKPLPEVDSLGLKSDHLKKTYEVLRILRSFYPDLIKHDRNPLHAVIGQQRYSLHTLQFFEANKYQKLWALYNSGHYGQIMVNKVKRDGPLRIDWLKSDVLASESVGLTILPGRKDYSRSTEEDLQFLVNQRIQNVVPLITDDELHDFGVENLMQKYTEFGLNVKRLPIKDQMASSNEEMSELVNWIREKIDSNEKTMIHCVGGLGRSGMVAASLLKSFGKSGQEAIDNVRLSRSPRAVESLDQEEFVHNFKSLEHS